MLLGILSDTHEHMEHIAAAKQTFLARKATHVIHLGDYCAGPSVRALEGLPLIGISGNNDGDLPRIMGNFQAIGADFRGEFCALSLGGRSIACYHGTVPEIVEALIDCQRYDVVLFGHTHSVREERRGKTLALNPGSAHGFDGDPPTVAFLETDTLQVEIVTLGG